MSPVSFRGRATAILTVWTVVQLYGAGSLAAQGIDRSQPPATGPAPTLKLPQVETAVLDNGLRLFVVPMHEVPLVQFSLSVPGGGRLDEGVAGLASFTANMLDEGADTLDAFGISAAAEYLGASLSTDASWDDIELDLKVPRRTMAPALQLLATVGLRPSFKAAEVARQRDLRLARILQQRDRPEYVADLAFNAILFPARHPYHHPLEGDSASTSRLDSALVRRFYQRNFCPDHATMVITGDLTLAEARSAVLAQLGQWKRCGGAAAGAPQAKTPAAVRTTVYLVDKPGAAQSVIRIGAPGVDRKSPDYFALEVMNTLLGGSFSSRLNTNLRETRGYTYGAGSEFVYRPLPGPFEAAASVRTDVTDSSLVEFMREFARIRDSAVSPVELNRAKSYIALTLPSQFETTTQVAERIDELLAFGLPLNYYTTYVQRIMGVSGEDVQRVARKYIDPARLSVVVVGDVAKIRAGIEALRLGPVLARNPDGTPAP